MQLHISTAVLMLASLTSTLASASALASSNINSVAHSARDITPRSFFHANQGLFRRATAEDPDLGEFDPACVLKYKCDADSEALLAKCQDGATDIKTGEVDAELSAKCLCKSSAFQTLYGKYVPPSLSLLRRRLSIWNSNLLTTFVPLGARHATRRARTCERRSWTLVRRTSTSTSTSLEPRHTRRVGACGVLARLRLRLPSLLLFKFEVNRSRVPFRLLAKMLGCNCKLGNLEYISSSIYICA
ncbi:hypothetical protein DFH27DRAFT_561912 [Peziza echinospora]|nr:hypothetical protein DFH27DRAFT_561912 [Peziza echinospora]